MSTIHCSCEEDASRSLCMVGRATLRIVLSSPITSNDRHSTASVHQRRGSAASFDTRLVRFISATVHERDKKRKGLVSKLDTEALNEALGKHLARFESRLRARLRK